MLLFLIGLCILIVGYFWYGKIAEKIFAPDGRDTPAVSMCDGVDYVALPHWKNMLIQLLNIAGIGPVIGVIIGIKFGAIVFLFIPIGNIIGGAVHDFASGMMSLRYGGANLPTLVNRMLGKSFGHFFIIFMIALLLLVVAVFINIPAGLIDGFRPAPDTLSALADGGRSYFWYAVAAIFLYYIAATLFPVDKIIGNLYPVFGGLLLLGTLAIFGKLIYECALNPALLAESDAFKLGMFNPEKAPILPMLFVTIACGILSGFHATQSPIIARTMKSERQARSSFYGMMVLEGIIAMVWAAAALAIFNLKPVLMAVSPTVTLKEITSYFLGRGVGDLTIISVIILAVTSGDTAMRSLRLSLAEKLGINQKPLLNRVLLCLPLVVLVALLLWWSNQSAKTFGQLWNYFAWGNQVLAACTLTAATVWLTSLRKPFWITLVPGVFMTFIVLTYILWVSPKVGGPLGLGLPLPAAYAIAAVAALLIGGLAVRLGRRKRDDAF